MKAIYGIGVLDITTSQLNYDNPIDIFLQLENPCRTPGPKILDRG